MAFDILKTITDTDQASYTVSDKTAWNHPRRELFVNQRHDLSELSLVLPDDCLIYISTPRFSDISLDTAPVAVGFVQSMQIQQQSQVQPLKGIGSRRHIFAKTNAPVNIAIQRLLFSGPNLLRLLHYNQTLSKSITNNGKYKATSAIPKGSSVFKSYNWNTNIEEDLYRIPFGIGIVFNGPAQALPENSNGFEWYIEACTLVSHSVSIQSGQAMAMEDVQIMADRVISTTTVSGLDSNATGAYTG